MQLDRLISFFSNNPSAKLLSSPHSPYVVFFLNRHFKEEEKLASPQSAIQEHLSRYLDQIHETQPEILKDRAEAYLNRWSKGDTRWLRRYFDQEHAESVYQLTPHSEDVLQFLADVLDRSLGFVGTESRLTRMIETLTEIVVRGSDDPERRLRHLIAERDRIEEEIRSIESGEAVSTYSPTAIRERFSDVVNDLVSLQGDFREVEDRFKAITRDVQKQQAEAARSRGGILGDALDAEDRLKQGDQGASFDAFVRLILSQNQQDELERIIAQLDDLIELAEQVDGKQRVKGMIDSLSAEASRVLGTTRRLSSTLRRLLDSRASTTRLRLAQVLSEIQAAATKLSDSPPEVGMEVNTELNLLNIWQRTFWESSVEFDDVELSNDQPDEDDRLVAFRHLAEMQRLDWETMRGNIAALVQTGDSVSLPELLEVHPLESGSIEVLGYLQLAHDDGHEVDESSIEIIHVEDPEYKEGLRPYEVPRVVFRGRGLTPPPQVPEGAQS